MRVPRSFRIDEKLLKQAKKMGLDVPSIVESAIAKAVKDKRCPYCKQKIKEKADG